MTEIISSNNIKAQRFHCAKQFIDDLCAITELGRTYAENYLKEIDLKLENRDTHVYFLNVDVNIVDSKIVCKTFYKKDSGRYQSKKMYFILGPKNK